MVIRQFFHYLTINQNNDSCNGIVTHQNGDGSDTVKLTATLSYNGKTTTKSFTMTVYQENAELSKQEILEAAAAKLSITYDGTTYGWQNVNLQTSVTVEDKNVDVSWDTVSTDSHLTLSGNTMSVIRDIADIPLSLKATLSYDGERYETTVPFTLTHIPEFVKTHTYSSTDIDTYSYIFDGSTLTCLMQHDNEEYGDEEVYSYTVDLRNKILAIKLIKLLEYDDGILIEYTKETLRDEFASYNARYISAWKQAYSNPTFENYCAMHGYDSSNPEEAAEVYDRLERLGYPSVPIDVIIRTEIDEHIDDYRQFLGLAESVSRWDVLEAYAQLAMEEELKAQFPDTETFYEYDIDYNTANTSNESWKNHLGFYAINTWTEGKHWFEVRSGRSVRYRSNENDFTISLIYVGAADYGDFSYDFKNNGNWVHTSGKVLFNETKTSFTVIPKGDSQTVIPESDRNWTITEDQPNKRIKITNPNKGDVYLYFEGHDL